MGQYYHPTNVDKMEYLSSHDYDNGLKLMEHSYVGNNFVDQVTSLLVPGGDWYKDHIVWLGDYADNQPFGHLYKDCDCIQPKNQVPGKEFDYLCNHTKQQYVVISLCPGTEEDWQIHPLPLLTCAGNGRGGGDFHGENEHIGTWAGDSISLETNDNVPTGYTKLVPDFVEK